MEPAYIGSPSAWAKPKRIDYRVKPVQKTPESANTKFRFERFAEPQANDTLTFGIQGSKWVRSYD